MNGMVAEVSGMSGWGSLAGALEVPTQVLQVTTTGLVLCLLGWAAWGLSSLDAGTRRRSRLFPRDPAEPGEDDPAPAPDAGAEGGPGPARPGAPQPEELNPGAPQPDGPKPRRTKIRAGRGSAGRRPGARGTGAPRGPLRRTRRWLRRVLPSRLLRGRFQSPPELLLLPLGLLAAWPTHSPLVAALAAGGVLPAIRLRRRRRQTQARERRRLAVVGLCAALAGELRTGATPQQAAEIVGGELRSSRGVSAAAGQRTTGPAPLDGTVLLAAVRYGGSVPEAFRTMAELPGAEGAAGIAACWQVASSSGAGLAAGLDRVAEGLRAERALHETVRAELAGARSTAALLAALPLFGLLLGAGLGADPLRVLLHTAGGLVCLALGALLECAGIAWTSRIARSAELAVQGT